MTVGRLLDLSETVSSFVKKEKECLPRAIAMMMKWAESIVEKQLLLPTKYSKTCADSESRKESLRYK